MLATVNTVKQESKDRADAYESKVRVVEYLDLLTRSQSWETGKSAQKRSGVCLEEHLIKENSTNIASWTCSLEE